MKAKQLLVLVALISVMSIQGCGNNAPEPIELPLLETEAKITDIPTPSAEVATAQPEEIAADEYPVQPTEVAADNETARPEEVAADNETAQPEETKEEVSSDTSSSEEMTGRIYVADSDGTPVPGVRFSICSDSTCFMAATQENGIAEILLPIGTYDCHIVSGPEGYLYDKETAYRLADEGLNITVPKAE